MATFQWVLNYGKRHLCDYNQSKGRLQNNQIEHATGLHFTKKIFSKLLSFIYMFLLHITKCMQQHAFISVTELSIQIEHN